jgi:hypothetical protein
VTVLFAQNHVVELLRRLQAALGTHGELDVVAFDTAGGQLDILGVERVADVERGDAVGSELLRVHPQPHRITLLAENLHLRHAADGLQAFLQHLVGDVCELHQIARGTAYVEHDDGEGVGVGLGHHGRVGVGRQEAKRPGHFVTHVVGGGLQVDVEIELDSNLTLTVAAHRRKRANTGHAADGLFQPLRNLRVDHVGVGAGVVGVDGNDGGVDVGILAHAEKREPDDAEHHDRDRNHDRQDRTLYACGRKTHGVTPS